MPDLEKETIAFEIESNLGGRKADLAVKNFDKVKSTALKILELNPVFEVLNDDDKKRAKNVRTAFNNAVKAINRRRIDDVAEFTATFVNQCDELVKMFEERSKQFGEKIKAYENAQPKPTKFEVTIKSYDPKVIEEARAWAIAHNCEVK